MRWVPIVALAGCFDPLPPDGAPCGANGRCPTGQTCNLLDDRCYRDPMGRDAASDTPGVDAPVSSCMPRRLLTGGTDVTQQGWSIQLTGSGSIAYAPGSTTLTTTNNSRQLIVLRDAFPPDRWMIQIVGEVLTSGGHRANHAAIALMPSFHDPDGDDNDRRRMLALDEKSFGWGEGGTTIGSDLQRQVVYRLERQAGGIKATVIGAGNSTMTASPFVSNGTIAIGDQTMDAGLDSSFRIITVDLVCP